MSMFPEDYINEISLLGIYGYPHAYQLYQKLNVNNDYRFYLNHSHEFVDIDDLNENNDSFTIGIYTDKNNIYENTCTLMYKNIQYSFVFDGVINNKEEVIEKLESKGYILRDYNNASLFALLFVKAQGDFGQKINQVHRFINGSYNYLIKYNDYMIAGSGIISKKRMLVGKLDNGGFIITNNSNHLDFLNASFIKEIKNGECVYIYDNQMTSDVIEERIDFGCALNYIYNSNISSYVNNRELIEIKKEFIKSLNPVGAVVTYYPYDPVTYALEYASTNNLQFNEISYTKDNNIIYIDKYIKDKKIVVIKENMSKFVDMKDYVYQLYKRGAKEVHLKVLAPMLKYECSYDMNDEHRYNILFNETGIKEYLYLTSLEFISVENFMLSIKKYDTDSKICLKCIYK